MDRRCTSVVTSNPGLEQISLCTPSGTDHPLCNFSIPLEKDMADVMEILLLIACDGDSGGGSSATADDDVMVVFLGTVMDAIGFVVVVVVVDSEARCFCACGSSSCLSLDAAELELLLLELLVLFKLVFVFLFSIGKGILVGGSGGVLGRIIS